MCGIYGGYWRNPEEVPRERLLEAQRLLRHRGPDDHGLDLQALERGTLAFGHTRLSIIDLSPGGHQPMYSRDGRYVIIFNGEIYNYLELRQELRHFGHEFHTDSDTEVLLAAWGQWETRCLQKLIGMFAFAILDHHEKTVTLVRDAFGIKPLFYSITSDSLIFASELPTLLALRQEKAELNFQRAYDYLIYGVVDKGHETFVKEVIHLPPAHWIRIDLKISPLGEQPRRWWHPSIDETWKLSFDEAAENLRELFLESVKIHLRSYVPLGVALSGGIDSSAIACAVRHLDPAMEIHTFSYIGENGAINEEPWIDLVNAAIGARPHKVHIGNQELFADLIELMQAQGEPFGGTSMYAQYCVFRRAKQEGVTVVLEGQGADELLGGYNGYPGQMMLSYMEQLALLDMIRFAWNWAQWPERNLFMPWRALVGELLPDQLYAMGNAMFGRIAVPKWIDEYSLSSNDVKTRPIRPRRTEEGKGRRLMETLLQSMTVNGLPHLLRYGDRNAMAFSIENRVPFLTLPLAELVMGLPERYLVSPAGETKAVFRRSMRGIVPEAILDRRDKVGFETPMKSWMRELIQKELEHFISHKFNLLPFRSRKLKNCLSEDLESSKPIDGQLWRIYNLIKWYQQLWPDDKHLAA